MIIYLRPHHLICMQNFIGKGYNSEFTDNMASIISYLKNHADEKLIKITFDEDNICAKCPNQELKKCLKVSQRDSDYFIVLRLDLNKVYSWNDIKQFIKKYLDYKTFSNICSNCQWFYICNNLSLR